MKCTKFVANRLSDFCKAQGIILPNLQSDFRPQRSTDGMLFVVYHLQEPEQQRRAPLSMCFVDLQKAHDSVYRTENSCGRYDQSRRAGRDDHRAGIRQFHDGMLRGDL